MQDGQHMINLHFKSIPRALVDLVSSASSNIELSPSGLNFVELHKHIE